LRRLGKVDNRQESAGEIILDKFAGDQTFLAYKE
jgi:hypothetical protein